MISTPLELIRNGIVNGDWASVSRGYAAMTGEKVAPRASAIIDELREFVDKWKDEIFGTTNELQHGDDLADVVRDQDEDDEELEEGLDKLIEQESPQPVEPEEPEEEEEKPKTVDERARELRELRTANPEDIAAKFKVAPAQPKSEDGKRVCRSVAFTPGQHKNLFKDDKKLAAKDIADSVKLSKKKKPEPRRPPVKFVDVVCGKCKRKESVDPMFAPRRVDDEDSTYVCNNCIKRGN